MIMTESFAECCEAETDLSVSACHASNWLRDLKQKRYSLAVVEPHEAKLYYHKQGWPDTKQV